MKITFILPAIGKKKDKKYIGTWKMEPLMIAALSGLTDNAIEKEFFDDRIELIPYDTKTDLVMITTETYTAHRAYDIAGKFRKRGIPVILGGIHPTLLPDEAINYADSIVIGEAEFIWNELIQDVKEKRLKRQTEVYLRAKNICLLHLLRQEEVVSTIVNSVQFLHFIKENLNQDQFQRLFKI
jgi:radical SAM superfamily enzyme YgiQ (UPF0313 family)